MADYEISMAAEADIDDAVEIYERSVRSIGDQDGRQVSPNFDWKRELRLRIEGPEYAIFIARADGRVVGIQSVRLSFGHKKTVAARIIRRLDRMMRGAGPGPTEPFATQKSGYLSDKFVDPDYRRRGIGRALAEAAAVWAKDAGADMAFCHIAIGNEAWKEGLETIGFESSYTVLRRELR